MVARLALCILLFSVAACNFQMVNQDADEITSYQYTDVKNVVDEYPQLRPVVKKMVSDGKITTSELRQLNNDAYSISIQEDKNYINQTVEELRR